METKRINLSDRIVAFLLACTMIFTILPCPVINAEDLHQGIGIYNHILTEQSSTQTVYKIKLYRTQKTEVTPANEEERIKAIGEVKMVVKGLTARDIWDMSEYYAIVNENNDAVNKALELLTTDKKKKK